MSRPIPNKLALAIAAVMLLLLAGIVFVQAAFNLNPFISPSGADQIILLYVLSTLIFLVLTVFGFVMMRLLIKLWVERKQHKPGSRFKTSIVASLIGLTLIPAASLFAFAFGLVNRSIDKWFSVPVDQISAATQELNRQWRAEHEAMARTILDHLATTLPAGLDESQRQFRLRALMIIDDQSRLEMIAAEPGFSTQGVAQAIRMASNDSGEVFIEFNGDLVGARTIHTPAGPRLLAAIFPTPARIADLNRLIATQQQNYNELKRNQRTFKDTYVAMLALMTILVLFAAVWIGLFLSKRITIPIEALAEATREVSSGNLSHRVTIRADDELGMLVRLFNDMTARLQGTTEELEARRRYMEVILESIPSGVISFDGDRNITKINGAARATFHADKAHRLEDIFHGHELDFIRTLLDESASGAVTREITFETTGRLARSAVTASPLPDGGWVLVVEDLTEVIRAQTASAWRDVARRLAHEIKNPLTPIQLSAERIGRNVSRLPAASPRVTTVIGECVDAIIQEVSGLKHMVDEFVRFARLPAVSRVPHSMKDLVDRTLALYEDRLNGTRVSMNIPEDLPPVLMDTGQMKRVLVNLIDNALEALATETHQELKITCELARDNTMARLIIADTGRGISADDRERLFTPYFSTRKNGTGLGLAISSRIVSDHGGYIGVEPNAPKGTRFIIELPVCHES